MKYLKKIWFVGLVVLLLASSCENYFEVSPYSADVKSNMKNTHVRNMTDIEKMGSNNSGEFKFAVLADSHYNYHELSTAISIVNSRSDVDFVIIDGDFCDHGYLKEYEMFFDLAQKLNKPYLTVVGNHDYRSNGGKIYRKMYGQPNKRFIYNNNLFVLFDDVFWESDVDVDFQWLEESLKSAAYCTNRIVICHIPPFDGQFTDDKELLYDSLMVKYQVDYSIHGHVHSYSLGDYYNSGVMYLTVESILDKEFAIVSVNSADEIEVERIRF
ncbi:MAG TPA: metallophosphoesterase [Bacteroidales bacterium]|nr:metallophosphoesterase [Bacteroidales bacterium]